MDGSTPIRITWRILHAPEPPLRFVDVFNRLAQYDEDALKKRSGRRSLMCMLVGVGHTIGARQALRSCGYSYIELDRLNPSASDALAK